MFKRTAVLTSQTPFHYYSFEDGYYPTKATETALKSLVRCVKRQEGIAVILGGTGTGKSLMCNLLADRLEGSDLFAISINNTNGCTPKALYQSILFELSRPYLGLDENEMRLVVLDILTDPARYPVGLVLIIDEAHNLPQETLEELRQINNGRIRRASGLSVVLSGNLRLEENLSHPRLESFQQRISTRVCLDPWTKKEVTAYITARLKSFKDKVPAKSSERVRKFSVEACDAVYTATGGVERLVSQLCDQAYLSAVEQKKLVIEAPFIQSVWAQIQALPDPCQDTQSSESSSESCIEFGSLDDDDFSSDWKSAGDVDTGNVNKKSVDESFPDRNPLDDKIADEEDPFIQAAFGTSDEKPKQSKPSLIRTSKRGSTRVPLKKSNMKSSDRFAINFDDLDTADNLVSDLLNDNLSDNISDKKFDKKSDKPSDEGGTMFNIYDDNDDDDNDIGRRPTPVEQTDEPIQNAINRANSIIDQIDNFAALFSSYYTSDCDTIDTASSFPTSASVQHIETVNEYTNPFNESFEQEENLRRDSAHPVPPSPYAKNHEGTVNSTNSSTPKNKGVY